MRTNDALEEDIEHLEIELSKSKKESLRRMGMVDSAHAEITRLTNENHRLRAALLTWTFDNTSDDERTEFEYAIMELKAALSGENYDTDMAYIARFNHDNINIDEVK